MCLFQNKSAQTAEENLLLHSMRKTTEGLRQDLNAGSDFSEKIRFDAFDEVKSLSRGGRCGAKCNQSSGKKKTPHDQTAQLGSEFDTK